MALIRALPLVYNRSRLADDVPHSAIGGGV